jgi:hypothetical protein
LPPRAPAPLPPSPNLLHLISSPTLRSFFFLLGFRQPWRRR